MKHCFVGLSSSAESNYAEQKKSPVNTRSTSYLRGPLSLKNRETRNPKAGFAPGAHETPIRQTMAAYRADAYSFRRIRFAAAGFDRQLGQREWLPQWR